MKISVGTNIKEGPWGGGNLFAINLTNYLRDSGHEVVFNLEDGDIDIILLMDPRKSSESSSFLDLAKSFLPTAFLGAEGFLVAVFFVLSDFVAITKRD